ncbi:hypothetical protein GCM10010182_11190 [Actinomadura cremea]|nr:hypothetical protein GCM10010182_11190 [Actinomadura cremea]
MSQEGPERERAARLLSLLRDLARARRDPAAHRRVHWLADLPGDVYVETDAGPGDVLFSLPVIPLTPPAVLEEFDGWLALRHWYRLLRDLADDEGDDEVVLGAGLLSWRPAHGPPVHDHLLSTPVRIAVDERTERVDVVLTGPVTLRDGDVLDGRPGFRGAHRASGAVRDGHGFGLHASAGDVLREWCDAALVGAVDFRTGWTPDETGTPVPQVRLAPALVVRPPGREAVARYHARMIELLADGVPAGLARFVTPGRSPQVMRVPDRTPATVPELLEGLLVRGRRVLVAAPGPAAAAALHAALPPGLAALAATDPAAARTAVEALRAAPPDDLDALTDTAATAAHEAAELRGRDLGAPARREPPAELAWMPPGRDLPPDPPISAREAADLVALLAGDTSERRARPEQRDVDPGALPSAAYVRTLVEAERAAAERAGRAHSDMSRLLRDADVTLVARLDGAAAAVSAALHDLGLDGHPGGWNPADLAVRAFADALAQRRPTVWARVTEMTARAEWARRALTGMGGRRVELPPGELHLRRLASVAQDLRTYLADGGTLKRGPLRSQPQRQAEVLLQYATVDGEPPTTPEMLDLVFTDLMVRMTCQELQYAWEAAGISFPADLPPTERVDRFVRAHARLARLHEVLPAVNETRELLAGLHIPLSHPLQWHGYVTALQGALEGLGVNRAAADLDALRDSIGPADPADPPELADALAAIDARDADAYGHALAALAEARHERALQVRCGELLERVRAVHPDLAHLLAATDGDEAWRTRVRRWDDAWTWARGTALSPAEERLRATLAAAERRATDAEAELAAARARTAARARLQAASPDPMDVVPAWILPLWRIPEVLPPHADAFDAVILDGEHGAGAEALFVLWLAPRVILVGEAVPELPPPDGPAPEGLQELPDPTAPLFTILAGEPPPPVPPEGAEPREGAVPLDGLAPHEGPTPPGAVEPRAGSGPREEFAPYEGASPRGDSGSQGSSGPRGGSAPPEGSTPRGAGEPRVGSGPGERAPACGDSERRGGSASGEGGAPGGGVEAGGGSAGRHGDGGPRVRRGRSIATYKRLELLEIIRHVAGREPELGDEQLIELVGRLLGCPEDEALLVGARLRYAVEAFREESGVVE